MGSLEILHKGLMSSVQDMGRQGLAFYAIPSGGAMDLFSAQQANLLVGNPIDSPLIECTMMAPSIRFDAAATIAICGSNMQWHINQEPVSLNQAIKINAGDILTGKSAASGLRSYVAIQGKLMTEQSYGSYSTYPLARLGGNKGRYLEKGDSLVWKEVVSDLPLFEIKSSEAIIGPSDTLHINIHKGPEYGYLDDASRIALTKESFIITADSNRMGARLSGPLLKSAFTLKHSKGVLPGFIQLLPSGQLVVLLQDGQTTGGYPRIAYIRGSDLSRFNQLAFHRPFSFQWGD